MTQDEAVWFKIAGRTGCSVSRAMAETTISQFHKWKYIFEEENAGRTDDLFLWHLAQIAREVSCVPARVWGKNPRIETKEFLMKLYDPSEDAKPPTPEVVAARQSMSRGVWGAAAAASRMGFDTASVPAPMGQTLTSG